MFHLFLLFKIAGKIGAYAIAATQLILDTKKVANTEQAITVLVVADNTKMCQKIKAYFDDLTIDCQNVVSAIDFESMTNIGIVECVQAKQPDVVIATPATIVAKLRAGVVKLNALKMLIVDNIELILTLGYENELYDLIAYVPTIYKSIYLVNESNRAIEYYLSKMRHLKYETIKNMRPSTPSTPPTPPSSSQQPQQLYQFLYSMLREPTCDYMIKWMDSNGGFKIMEPRLVAAAWGRKKNIPNMDYPKLSRSLRYYYKRQIIQKIKNKQYQYAFVNGYKA